MVSDEKPLYFFQNLNYPIAQRALVQYGDHRDMTSILLVFIV